MSIATFDASEALTQPLRGWGRYVAELARALGHARPSDVQLRFVHGGDGRLPELVWEQWGLARCARRQGAAVLHSPNCFLPLRRPCAGVVTVHDLAFEAHPDDFSRRTGMKYRAVVPRAVRSAERVICDSHFTAGDLAARYGVDPGRVRVIALAPALPTGVEGARSAAADAPYLLGVGDLRAKKDFATLVRAWLALRRSGRQERLLLAGTDGGQARSLRALAGREPLELLGYVSDAELDGLLCGARALVHPSRYEGFGLVLLEAMARGTVVVAARATALPETGGDAAAYFAPGDSDELAGVLERLLDDDAARAELVARGLVRAAAHTWERTAAATLDVYRELV